MGACNGGGFFVDSDWRRGISIVQKEAEREHGVEDGYSGAANSCSFRYVGQKLEFAKKTKTAEKELYKYIDERMENHLGSGDGEIIKLDVEYYGIITTEIVEEIYTHFDSRYYLKLMKKGPAILIEPYDYDGSYYRIIAEGTVADLKKKAHAELRKSKYDKDLYIVGKTKTYLCTGKIKQQKATKRETDDKVLVLPFYKYVYYGWFRE